MTIASGTTVTVEPGAVIKLSGSLTATGILDAEGTTADPITFTSAQDSGSPGWAGIRLNSSGSVVNHAAVRHSTQAAAIRVESGSSPSITNSRITQSLYGVSVSAGGAPEISHNEITDISGYAIYYGSTGAPAGSQVNIHDNEIRRTGSASGAAVSVSVLSSSVAGTSLGDNLLVDNDGMAISYQGDSNSSLPTDLGTNTLTDNEKNAAFVSGKVNASANWGAGTYVINQWDLQVVAGATLTLHPGVVVKGVNGGSAASADGKLTANGVLDAQGTSSEPIVFTSLSDDSAGGDSNADGSTATTVWSGVELQSSGSMLEHVQVRNDGYTGGVTADVRQLIGIDNVDYCSPYYVGLSAAGEVAGWLPGPGTTLRVGVKGASLARRVMSSFAARGADDVLSTPKVASQKLQNIIDDLYRGTTNPNRVGTGTTADAIRYERTTGQSVGGRLHTEKGYGYSQGLRNWLRQNPDAPHRDRLVARSLYDDLQGALRGQ